MERDAIWMVDAQGHERGGCCMSMTLRDYGRVGQFILEGGAVRGKRILPEWWVAQATTPQITSNVTAVRISVSPRSSRVRSGRAT